MGYKWCVFSIILLVDLTVSFPYFYIKILNRFGFKLRPMRYYCVVPCGLVSGHSSGRLGMRATSVINGYAHRAVAGGSPLVHLIDPPVLSRCRSISRALWVRVPPTVFSSVFL